MTLVRIVCTLLVAAAVAVPAAAAPTTITVAPTPARAGAVETIDVRGAFPARLLPLSLHVRMQSHTLMRVPLVRAHIGVWRTKIAFSRVGRLTLAVVGHNGTAVASRTVQITAR